MVLRCLVVALLAVGVPPVWAQDPDYTIRIDVTASKDGIWREIHSPSFVVVGNVGEKQLRRIIVDLEELRRQFLTVFPGAELRSGVGTTIIVFRNRKSFQSSQPFGTGPLPNPAGYVQPGSDITYIALNAAESNRRDLYYAYLKALAQDSPIPLWLREGLAEYYSTFADERYLLGDSRTVEIGHPILKYEDVLKDRNLIPLSRLIDLEEQSLSTEQQTIFRAESWALVHMLQRQGESLKAFVNLMESGAFQDEGFRDAFNSDPSTLEPALRNYIRESKTNGWGYTQTPYCMCTSSPLDWLQFNSDGLQADIKKRAVRNLSLAELHSYIGDLMLHSGHIREAEAYLQNALRLEPERAFANVSLGSLRLQQNRFSEAAEFLMRALALDPRNPLAQFYSAQLIRQQGLRAGTPLSVEKLESMQSALTKALQIAPHFQEARNMLMEVNTSLGRADLNTALDERLAQAQMGELSPIPTGQQSRWVVSVEELQARKQSKNKK
jgi:tetratricopeptide (TPR) repeat protein